MTDSLWRLSQYLINKYLEPTFDVSDLCKEKKKEKR